MFFLSLIDFFYFSFFLGTPERKMAVMDAHTAITRQTDSLSHSLGVGVGRGGLVVIKLSIFVCVQSK